MLNKFEEIQYISNSYLVTMDVEALYTNIDHGEGLEALHHFLQQRPDIETPPTCWHCQQDKGTFYYMV